MQDRYGDEEARAWPVLPAPLKERYKAVDRPGGLNWWQLVLANDKFGFWNVCKKDGATGARPK